MRRDRIDGLPRLGLALLVAGAILTTAEQAPRAAEPEVARLERLTLPAIRGTCAVPARVSGSQPSTCVQPSKASREPSKEILANDAAAVTPPGTNCDEVPTPWHVLDGPRMTEC